MWYWTQWHAEVRRGLFHLRHTESLFIVVCNARHLNIWSTTAHPSRKSLVGDIYDQPVVTNWSYHATDAPCSATGLLLLVAQWSGTRCQMLSGILDTPLKVSDAAWKLSFSRPTSTHSTLVAFMMMRYRSWNVEPGDRRVLPSGVENEQCLRRGRQISWCGAVAVQ